MHFAYIVAINNDEHSFDNVLDMFYCDNTEQFEFQDCTQEVKTEWANWYKNKELSSEYPYKSEDQLAEDWFGYEKNEQGEWGRYSNPYALYDWYVIGGRWDGFFNDKNQIGLEEFKTWIESDNFTCSYGLITAFDDINDLTIEDEIKEDKEKARQFFRDLIKDLDPTIDWQFYIADLHY